MDFKFNYAKISSIISIIPKNESRFEDEIGQYSFPPDNSMKLKETMGYDTHRIAEPGSTITEYAKLGFNKLFNCKAIAPEEIDALLVVGSYMDYILPPTSNIIQGELNLKEDCLCLDIAQACAGFEIGLIQAFMFLQQQSIKKVALVNAELLSQKVSKKDRNSYPLIGDGVSITIIEKSNTDSTIYANLKMDGKGAFAIQIPAGGLAQPCSEFTKICTPDQYGNIRSLENMVMKGDEVFIFVQKKVPTMIKDLLTSGNHTIEDVDYFMFHQPNKFMLKKLARKLNIGDAKIPMNIVEKFGNSSGVTVPINICYNLKEIITSQTLKLCMAGFGGGLTWSSILMNVGPLNYCDIIEYPLRENIHKNQ